MDIKKNLKTKQKLNEFKKILFDDNGNERISIEDLSAIMQAKEKRLHQILPCEIDSNIFYIDEDIHGNPKIVKGKVDAYTWFRTCGFSLVAVWEQPIKNHFDYKRHAFPFTDIGKRYFLSFDEALQSDFLKNHSINTKNLKPLTKKQLMMREGEMVYLVESNSDAAPQWGIIQKRKDESRKEYYSIRTSDAFYFFIGKEHLEWEAYQLGHRYGK